MKLQRYTIEMCLPPDVDPSAILEKLQACAREMCEDSDGITGITDTCEDEIDELTSCEALVDDIMTAIENAVSVQPSRAPMVDHSAL